MALSILHKNIHKKVHDFFSEKFGRNVKYNLTNGASKSSSFISDIHRITVINDEAELSSRKKFILKVIRPTRVSKEVEFISNSFSRETAVYTNLFEEFDKLENRFDVKEKEKFKHVNVFASSDEKGEEFLLMEDLQELGYRVVDKFNSLDLNHINLIVENLAKFHALSFALKKYEPNVFEELYPKVVANDVTDIECYIRLSNQKAIDILENEKDKVKLKEYFEGLVEKVKLANNDDKTKNPYFTLCHADCWINNFMFKYEANNDAPLGVIILDWQVSGYSSPLQDVIHLIFLSTDGDFRKQYYKDVLQKYYVDLGHHLKKFNLSIDEIYPLDVFESDKMTYLSHGLGVTVGSLPFVLCEEDKKPQLDDVYGSDIDHSKVIYTDLIIKRIREGVIDILSMI